MSTSLYNNHPMLTKIEEIKRIREEQILLKQKELDLSAPTLTDLSMIEMLYTWFGEILSERDCPPAIESVTQRKKFIFIILGLFSPITLAGGKMTIGLRDKLADVIGIHSRTTISDNCADVVFLYSRYKNFREDVEDIWKEMRNRLEGTGVIIPSHS